MINVRVLFNLAAMDVHAPRPRPDTLKPGALLARGTARHLRSRDIMTVPEFSLPGGLRVDLMALTAKGELWVIECKSSRADFTADDKWHGYLDWADRFFWAVDAAFPAQILPCENGLIIADGYDADMIRMPDATPLAPARRRSVTLRLARCAAARAQAARDPAISPGA